MVKHLHPIGAALGSIGARSTLYILSLILNLLLLIAVYESWYVSTLHLVSWQELMALIFKMSVLLATVCATGSVLLRIKHAGSSLLTVSVWLSLRITNLGHGTYITSSSSIIRLLASGCAIIGSLGQVACIGKSRVIIWELRMRCSNFSFISPSLAWACTWILSHRRICHVASFGLYTREIILNHGHARVSWLNYVVILDGSEIKERFFLNRLTWLLLLWLNGRLETATIASVCRSMVRLLVLATIVFASILLLDKCGRLVHWRVLLH